MLAERLYQAIIDKVAEQDLDWAESAKSCGFDPDLLLECFDGKPHAQPLRIYDYIGREQVEATADFLECPRLRIFFLADVFRLEDLRALAKAVTGSEVLTRSSEMNALGQYMLDISRSQFFGRAEPLINEFVASTMSDNLREACSKTGLPYSKLTSWKAGQPGSLSDIEEIRRMASSMGLGVAPVLVALCVMKPGDFLWEGDPVDPIAELERALDVDIW